MLYIVGTPIGNLDDLSIRQAKTLASADIILAEDTRSAKILLEAIEKRFMFKVSRFTKIISYYKEKEFEKLPEVLGYLKKDLNVALISQSGMPLISDPGYLLVKTVIKEKIPFTVIPGPTALTTALVYSGFNPQNFMFLGFLPKKEAELKKLFLKLKELKKDFKDLVFVFYESPNRINKTLEMLNEVSPDSEVAITRELTKKHEETTRGKAKRLMGKNYKGEITFMLI